MVTLIMFRNRLGYECGDRGVETRMINYTEITGVRGAVNLGNKSGGQHG
jgi:hypothetical protein